MARQRWMVAGLVGGLLLLAGALLLGGHGAAAHPGGVVPAQGTPTATPTRTAGPSVTATSTSGVCLVTLVSATTLCAPASTYTYTFGFNAQGGFNPYANLTFYFEVATQPQGPWTTLDQQAWSGTLPLGYSERSGTFTEASIPSGYYYYHIRVQGYACNGIAGETVPTPICTRPTPTVTPNCATGWNVVDSPNIAVSANVLNAVAAAAPDDVWAVGYAGLSYTGGQTVVAHWNGSNWSLVGSPNPGSSDSRLNSVAVRAANDIWVVGGQANGGAEQTLTMHWDGAGWTVVPSPNPGTGENVLQSVTALAPDDVWAVGHARSGPSGPIAALILHWDGTAWTQVPSPAPPYPYNELTAVAASGPQDVWAVGWSSTVSYPYTLIEHWDGSTWQIVPSPNPSTADNYLYGMVALASNDAWAVGTYFDLNTGYRPLILHWDGSVWTQAANPNAPAGYSYLEAIGGRANDLWAVGLIDGGGTLIEHWNGSAWSLVVSPSPGERGHALLGVVAPGQYDAWAVGTFQDWDGSGRTLIEHYTGPCASATPTATPTFSPTPVPTWTPCPCGSTFTPSVTPSASQTAPTSPTLTPPATATETLRGPSPTLTPLASATETPVSPSPTSCPCNVVFSDVQPGDYFYAAVQYLASRGVIAGYADGTFRPYNTTTRAQQVKIVVLGLALPITVPPAGRYTFADVPPAQPFFAYVETAAAHGVISGYACGGPGAPCDDQQRPYFRPNANVTRGQLGKIVVSAAGWTPVTPARPTFSDVPADSPFYAFVETAVCRGILSGYGDGTFRPGASAMRGQIAKIVYLAITAAPPCGPLLR